MWKLNKLRWTSILCQPSKPLQKSEPSVQKSTEHHKLKYYLELQNFPPFTFQTCTSPLNLNMEPLSRTFEPLCGTFEPLCLYAWLYVEPRKFLSVQPLCGASGNLDTLKCRTFMWNLQSYKSGTLKFWESNLYEEPCGTGSKFSPRCLQPPRSFIDRTSSFSRGNTWSKYEDQHLSSLSILFTHAFL